MDVLLLFFVPGTVARPVELLRRLAHLMEAALRTLLHHVVKAIAHPIRQPRDKGILLGQHGDDLRRLCIPGDVTRHLHREFICEAHDREKRLLLLRQRIDHRLRKGCIDVGLPARQLPVLGKCPKIQIYRREPALTRVQQGLDLRIREIRAAAMRIDRKLRVVESQLFRPDLIHLRPEPHGLRRRQETIPARDDQMHIGRQAMRQHTEKNRCSPIGQQMKIIDENKAGRLSHERMA